MILDPEIEALIRRYAEALNATNMALASLMLRVDRLERDARITRDRLMMMDAGKLFEEVEEGIPKGKLN